MSLIVSNILSILGGVFLGILAFVPFLTLMAAVQMGSILGQAVVVSYLFTSPGRVNTHSDSK